ncbi:hypothetical protein D9M68_916290 [compost metagenome]
MKDQIRAPGDEMARDFRHRKIYRKALDRDLCREFGGYDHIGQGQAGDGLAAYRTGLQQRRRQFAANHAGCANNQNLHAALPLESVRGV